MSTDELPDSPFDAIDESSDLEGNDDLGGDAGGSPRARLFDGDAEGPQVGKLKSDYDMPQWMAVLSRGIMRVATGSGVPPAAEILIGSIMGFMGSDMDMDMDMFDADSSTEDTDSNGSSPGGSAGSPAGVDI